MIVGVPKEIKNHEYRVGLVPRSVSEFVRAGHSVKVETQAGAGIGASDDDYRAAGAEIVDTAEEIFATAEMVVKVKEPQLHECAQLREGQILYTYLHLAPDWAQTDALIKSGATCIAYETVTDANGRLPLLAPMSRVAGRMSIQAAASGLEKRMAAEAYCSVACSALSRQMCWFLAVVLSVATRLKWQLAYARMSRYWIAQMRCSTISISASMAV